MLKGKPTTSNSSPLPYTKEFENIKRKLSCSEHSLEGDDIFCWVDASQPNAPHYPLCTRDLQEWAKYLVSTSTSYDLTGLVYSAHDF